MCQNIAEISYLGQKILLRRVSFAISMCNCAFYKSKPVTMIRVAFKTSVVRKTFTRLSDAPDNVSRGTRTPWRPVW